MSRSPRWLSAAMASLLLAGVFHPLSGQSAFQPLVIFGTQTGLGTVHQAPLVFAPDLRGRTDRLTARLSAAVDIGSTTILRNWDGAASWRLLSRAQTEWRIVASASHSRPLPGPDRWGTESVELRASRTFIYGAASVTGGLARSSNSTSALVAPVVKATGEVRRFGMVISGELRFGAYGVKQRFNSRVDTTGMPRDSVAILRDLAKRGGPVRAAFTTQAGLALAGVINRTEVEAAVGTFFVNRTGLRPYGSLMLTHWMTPGAAIIAGVGKRVLDPIGGSSVTNLMFGLKLGRRRSTGRELAPESAPSTAQEFQVERQGDSVEITLTIPGASHVELRGDPTDWTATTLSRGADGRWRMTLHLPPGVYRAQVRVNGADWIHPPGTARVADPYEGFVGVLVIP